MVFYAIVAWVVLMPFAIANGAFRQSVLLPRLGDTVARAISSLMLSAFVFVFTAVFLVIAPGDETTVELVAVSLTWLTLTVLFEFGYGHYLRGLSWSTVFADYNVFRGRLWSLVLASEIAAPLLIGSVL